MSEYEIELDWRGFELHPETPEGGMELSKLFGAARVEAMRGRMAQFAASFGVREMRHSTRLPNTRRALAVAELARDRGLLDAYRDSAMRAHWREGMDLEKDEDLAEVARRAGLDAKDALAASRDPKYLARVDEIRKEASEMGVTGIPTFIFGDRLAVVGCQPVEVLAAAAEQAGARRRA
jgi:predicted DsbA family dithiol-disulfide isomerase